MSLKRDFVILISLFLMVYVFRDEFGHVIAKSYITALSKEEAKKHITKETLRTGLAPCNLDSAQRLKNGSVHVNITTPTWDDLFTHTARNLTGGHYKPPTCLSEHRVAVIVPYRDRDHDLRTFLQHMHPFLQQQRLEYKIYVVEQIPGHDYDRDFLVTIGVIESRKSDNFTCFILHDVNNLPEYVHKLYTCGNSPEDFAIVLKEFNDSDLPLHGVSKRDVQEDLNNRQYEVMKNEDRVLYTWYLVSLNRTETHKPRYPITDKDQV